VGRKSFFFENGAGGETPKKKDMGDIKDRRKEKKELRRTISGRNVEAY